MTLQRTSSGVHRDDIGFFLNDCPFKTEASQGQRKSLLFAIKLAEWEYLRNTIGTPPILLLDDVFEKLDEERISNLLKRVCTGNEGQVFITDTNEERLHLHLNKLNTGYSILVM